MERKLQERMIGATVLVIALVIIGPLVLDGGPQRELDTDAIPGQRSDELHTHTFDLRAPDATAAAAVTATPAPALAPAAGPAPAAAPPVQAGPAEPAGTPTEAPVVERWAGLRPKAIGREPMVGRHPGHPNVSLMAGGFKVSFGLAHELARTVLDEIAEDIANEHDENEVLDDVECNEPTDMIENVKALIYFARRKGETDEAISKILAAELDIEPRLVADLAGPLT